MDITVILCTYNRCQSLVTALESVALSVLPEQVDWEILIIDNNSSDRTRDVAEDFCRRYPNRFRYLFEPHQGKSYALNTGIREARGHILAFMDDDVTVEPTWLQNLTGDLYGGEWVGAGGRILPLWSSEPPSWLPQNESFGMAPLVTFGFGSEPGPLADPPFGTNMAFHRSMFEKYGFFRTDLGPRPNSEIRNEDTEFGRRLISAGEGLKYEPTAVVHHLVPENRLKRSFFLNWWFARGRAAVLEEGIARDEKWSVSGIPLILLRKVAVGAVRWTLTVGPSRRFARKLTVWLLAGKVAEYYHQSGQSNHKLEKQAVFEGSERK